MRWLSNFVNVKLYKLFILASQFLIGTMSLWMDHYCHLFYTSQWFSYNLKTIMYICIIYIVIQLLIYIIDMSIFSFISNENKISFTVRVKLHTLCSLHTLNRIPHYEEEIAGHLKSEHPVEAIMKILVTFLSFMYKLAVTYILTHTHRHEHLYISDHITNVFIITPFISLLIYLIISSSIQILFTPPKQCK